jgi:6-phosphogluconolactonase
MPDIEVSKDASGLARAAAGQFITLAASALAARGRFAAALSGGSTPKAMFKLLATKEFSARIDWPGVHLFWGDERCVPPDHPSSNYRMTRETLLDEVPLPPANIHRIHGELEPSQGAAAYEQELRTFFKAPAVPVFDLILLGMGDNGHTASLFPGRPTVHEQVRWVVADYVAEVSMWRITFTPLVINAAANVSFLVAGPAKADMLHRVLEGPYQPDLLPAQIVKPVPGRLLWLVDSAAAVNLESKP